MMINNMVFFTVWFLFFHRFESVRGWQLGDMAALYGASATSFGLAVIFGEGIRDLARTIVQGDLDAYLTQPKPLLLQVACSQSNATGWGDIVSGIVLFAISGHATWASAPWMVIAPVLGAVVFLSVALCVCSLAFWFGPMEGLAKQFQDFTMLCSVYPSPIFTGVLRPIIFTVLPAGFVSHLPVTLIRDFHWANAGGALLGACVFAATALTVFHRGLRHYSSGNRFGVR